MLDFTSNPQDSPYIWCTKCNDLVPIDISAKRMNTGFRAVPLGVFPLGECIRHATIYSCEDVDLSCVIVA